MNLAAFLDRDGVINRAIVRDGRPYPPPSLETFEFLPGVDLAIRKLRAASFKIVVVTNQPDIATGIQQPEVLEAMHLHIRQVLQVDDIRVCCHIDKDNCACRKPKPGMLLDAAKRWDIDLQRSYMVGDRWRDIEAGHAAGCRTILIENDYQEKKAENPGTVVRSLLEASEYILMPRSSGGTGLG